MSSSGARRGYGTTVTVKIGNPVVDTEIVGIEGFDMPDQTPDNIDATHLTSPEDTEEFVLDMKKAPTWELSHHYVPGSDMDAALSAVSGTGETFILEIAVVGAAPVEYAVYLNNYRATGIAPKGSVMMAASTFTVMGQVAA